MTTDDPADVVLVDKPAGITSHDVVREVRRERAAKTGHTGTLDPFATGLLILLVGRRATREQARFMALPKTYRTVAQLGAISDTGDPYGEIVETGRIPARLELPTGQIRQRPPTYSAVKVAGVRAYRRARGGERFELPERVVTVYRFAEVQRDADRVELEVECSSGTYVRSLVAGLGDAYCLELRRTRIGPFAVEEADRTRMVALDDALARLDA